MTEDLQPYSTSTTFDPASGYILIVDDDPVAAGMLGVTLSDSGHEVVEMHSGDEALAWLMERAAASRSLPDVVFLDIEMPGLDGYGTCRLLRAGWDMPVVFLSSHDKLEERLEAFAAGGDDFVAKPYETLELLSKVERLILRRHELARLRAEQSSLLDLTHGLLKDFGRTDVVLAFTRENIHCVDFGDLAASLIRAADEYNIRCHVQLRHDGGVITVTPSGPASPLEESVFEQCAGLGPVFRFGRSMIFNHDGVSLLVLRMPAETETAEKVGQRLAVLTENAAAIAETIEVRKQSAQRAEALQTGSAQSYSAIEELREKYRAQQADTRMLLQKMVDDIEALYVNLGLTDGQEAAISSTLRDRSEDILRLFDIGNDFEEQFSAILDSLQPESESSSPSIWLF